MGASHLHYDCYFIQEGFKRDNQQEMAMRYNRIVENTISFVEFTSRFLREHEKDAGFIKLDQLKPPLPTDIPLAQGFSIVKVARPDCEYLCLDSTINQSVEQRINQRFGEQIKPDGVDFVP